MKSIMIINVLGSGGSRNQIRGVPRVGRNTMRSLARAVRDL